MRWKALAEIYTMHTVLVESVWVKKYTKLNIKKNLELD